MSNELLAKIIRKENLTSTEAESIMQRIMHGQENEISTAALLVALAAKGETGTEIASFAKQMRNAAKTWPSDQSDSILCDTCGTGGDGASTLNISTLSAIILASLGISVAKHGNRGVSSKSGSADLLEGLNINIDTDRNATVACLQKIGITFLYAPNWHPAMKYVAPVRKALKVRTIFNLLGPITNPAPVHCQLIGVFDKSFVQPIGEALAALGKKAYVVCSQDGLDEVSWAAPTDFIRVGDGQIQESGTLSMQDFGVKKHSLEELKISGSKEAVERGLNFLDGKGSEAENHAIAMNAALVYSLAKKASLKESTQACLEAIQTRKGLEKLEQWRSIT